MLLQPVAEVFEVDSVVVAAAEAVAVVAVVAGDAEARTVTRSGTL